MEEAGSRVVAESAFEFAVGQVSRNRPALALEQSSSTSSRRIPHSHPESQGHPPLN